MKVTMQQIAEQAGVSRATVDKVLHGRGGVSPDMTKKIQQLLEDSGYRHRPRASRSPAANSGHEVAIITPSLSDPYHRSAYAGMRKGFAAYSQTKLSTTHYQMNTYFPDSLLPILEQLSQKPPSGIIMQGVLDTEVKHYLEEFNEKHIPVVLYDSDMPQCPRLCSVGENALKSGKIAASLFAKRLNKTGSIIIVGGMRQFLTHSQRIDGFVELLQRQYPDIEVLECFETMDNNSVYNFVRKSLEKYPHLTGIYSATGYTAGVARALIDSNSSSRVSIIGYHNSGDVKAMVEIGIIDFALDVSPHLQGYTAADILCAYLLENRRPPDSTVYLPTQIFIDENLDIAEDQALL